MKNLLICFGIIAAILIAVRWSNNNDKKIQMASDQYEKCVRTQYGMSPDAWHQETGVYPECK